MVDAGGFSAAGRALGVGQSAVSRRIAGLERRLGTRLLVRSTRKLRLTHAGEAFHARCRTIVAALDAAEAEAGVEARAPSGVLRLGAPPVFARRVLVPRLAPFLARHPDVALELVLGERFVDFRAERCDVAIRLPTPGDDPELIARRLARYPLVAVAAPAWLAAHGTPRRPRDLARRPCLVQSAEPARDRWRFDGPGGSETVRVAGPVRANDVEALRVAAVAGLGAALLPSFVVDDDLRTGVLRRLLPRWRAPCFAVWAVHRERRLLPMKARVFLDFLADALGD